MNQKVSPADLVPLDIFEGSEPLIIELVYANEEHKDNMFDTNIYAANTRLWAHKDLATITVLTARALKLKHNWTLKIVDCLRTYDSQAAMQETEIAKANPDWMIEPNRMLSPPGLGAHPRAMAIDVDVIDENKNPVDMGTSFDHMDKSSSRSYRKFPQEILMNRQDLEQAFVNSAKALDLPIVPLSYEWWDFRFPVDMYDQFDPLHDAELPPQMQMTQRVDNGMPNFDDTHFQKLKDDILQKISTI